MTDYIISTRTARHEAGLTAARLAFNAARPPDPEPVEGEEVAAEAAAPGPFETNEEYLQNVFDPVLESYANQHVGRAVETDDPDLVGKTVDVGGELVNFVEKSQ